MLPHTQPRKKRNSSKVNMVVSITFHTLLVAALLYFAARSGILGHKIQTFAVTLEKPKEKPKLQETPKPKPMVEPPKPVEVPKPVETKSEETPNVPPSVAPAPAVLPTFAFGGGADVSSGDPVEVYKTELQNAILAKWNRPDDPSDDSNVAYVEVSVGRDGQISDPVWRQHSGNSTWDASVSAAIAAVTSMDTPPPTNFPSQVMVKFDVETEAADTSLLP